MKNIRKLHLIIFLIFLLNYTVISQPLIKSTQEFKWTSASFAGPIFSLSVDGNYLYTGMGSKFSIFNISNPINPIFVGSCHTTDCITYIKTDGNKCFIGNNALGIAVADISNPSDPQIINYIAKGCIPGYCLTIEGNIGFFPMGSDGLWTYNISTNDTTPFCTWGVGAAGHDFTIEAVKKDSIIYITDRANTLKKLKFKNNTLSYLSQFQINGYYSYECKTDPLKNYLYVTGRKINFLQSDSLRLWIFNISNPDNISLIGTYKHNEITNYPLDLKINNNTAYISCWEKGVIMINVSNPSNPQYINSIPTSYQTNWADVSGIYTYIADLSGGFKIANTSNPSSPNIVYNYDTCGDTKKFIIAKNHAYTIIENTGIGIAEISNNKVTEKNIISINDNLHDITCLNDSLLFIAKDTKGVLVLSLNNVYHPDSVGLIKHTGDNGSRAVKVRDDTLLVIETVQSGLWKNCTIYIWDISNINTPNLLGSKMFHSQSLIYDFPVINLSWYKNLVAITLWQDGVAGNFYLLNISNPSNVTTFSSMPSVYFSDVKLFNNGINTFAAISSGTSNTTVQNNNGIRIYNVDNPQSMNLIYSKNYPGMGNRVAGIDVKNNFLITSEGGLMANGLLRVFDISNIASSFLSDSLIIGSNTSNGQVLFNGDNILHSSGSPGLMCFLWNQTTSVESFTEKTRSIKVIIFPNPTNDVITVEINSTQKTNGSIVIYNIDGKKVYEIINVLLQKGINNFIIPIDNLNPSMYIIKIITFIETKSIPFIKI